MTSLLKDVWTTLTAVVTGLDKLKELTIEVRALREENRDLRDRVVRVETIIDEARRSAPPAPAKALPSPPSKRRS